MASVFVLNVLKALFSCLFFAFCCIGVSAQVVTTVGGYPVVDLSSFTPLGCVLTSSEASSRRTQMNAQTPSNSAELGVGSGVSDHSGTWNAKMSIKYQLMCADHTVGSTNWANAYTLCKQYSGEGGGTDQWRLPTQREHQMIAALHPQLRGISGFTSFGASYYWSSTERDPSNTWCVYFLNGGMYSVKKTNWCRVRCVRDL